MRKVLIVCSLLGFFAIAAAIGGVLLVGDPSKSTAGSNRIIIVKSGAESLPLSDAALNSRGAKIFSSWSDARAAVDDTTRAMIVADSTLFTADSKWVRDSVHGGMVVGAFDVSPASLATAFGLYGELPAPDGAQLPPPELDDGSRFTDETFFSLLFEVQTPNHTRRGFMADRFRSADQFFAHVERYVADANAITGK